ncbi:hypothetical protein KEU06_23205 [Pseudaminobacter sp. 19-2017]|uniref:Uncharacterized protein n=1 Tax=Pseudaminobacter soli (ex Zhang et al. 2022) TaxID=2831468 RepID=A0A942IAP7_9HYPH|nr:hypothetical protein [Pseudaminobacter soli]MBS3651530.1 hypothetical protein [Pseudaminobacter soli]
MANTIHPGAPHHLPPFITAPGETDWFYNGSVIFIVVLVLALGSLYFRLHALPERLAHKNPNKVQFEIVAVLALLALFTHNTLYWVAALLLAFVRFPDFATPLTAMAESLARLASGRRVRDVEGAPAAKNEGTPVPVDIKEASPSEEFPWSAAQLGPPPPEPSPALDSEGHDQEATSPMKQQIPEKA